MGLALGLPVKNGATFSSCQLIVCASSKTRGTVNRWLITLSESCLVENIHTYLLQLLCRVSCHFLLQAKCHGFSTCSSSVSGVRPWQHFTPKCWFSFLSFLQEKLVCVKQGCCECDLKWTRWNIQAQIEAIKVLLINFLGKYFHEKPTEIGSVNQENLQKQNKKIKIKTLPNAADVQVKNHSVI